MTPRKMLQYYVALAQQSSSSFQLSMRWISCRKDPRDDLSVWPFYLAIDTIYEEGLISMSFSSLKLTEKATTVFLFFCQDGWSACEIHSTSKSSPRVWVARINVVTPEGDGVNVACGLSKRNSLCCIWWWYHNTSWWSASWQIPCVKISTTSDVCI